MRAYLLCLCFPVPEFCSCASCEVGVANVRRVSAACAPRFAWLQVVCVFGVDAVFDAAVVVDVFGVLLLLHSCEHHHVVCSRGPVVA